MDLPDKTEKVREKKAAVIPAGAASPTARPARRRFWDFVIAESPKAVVGQVAKTTLMPESKRVLETVLNNILHGILWNNGPMAPGSMLQGTVLRGNGVVMNAVNYSGMSSPQVQAAAAAGNTSGPYKDLKFTNSDLAEMVYASVLADLNQYSVVTVADLYEAANLTPEVGHNNYGWYSFEGARIVQDSDGVKLMLPKPVRV